MPKRLHLLYKSIEIVSEHSVGRLGGVALFSGDDSHRILLGRKALTIGDDRNHHIERVLIRELFSSLPQSGHLFIYTALPPCNTSNGCLNFYQRLAQENPNLHMTVFFDHEYQDGFNYGSVTIENLAFVNLVAARKRVKDETKRRKLIINMSQTLVRTTSDNIVEALEKRQEADALEVIGLFQDTVRRERLQRRVLEAKAADRKKHLSKKRKMRSRAR